MQTTRRIQELERDDTERLLATGVGHSGLLLMWFLLQQPVLRVKDIERSIGVSYTKTNSIVASAEHLGMLQQISKGKRNRKYAYSAYIDILSEGTELRG